jgi:predicted nucleotide-binding protein
MSGTADKGACLRRPREEVRDKLNHQFDEGQAILNYPISNVDDLKIARQEFDRWYDYTCDLLSKLFTTNRTRSEFTSLRGVSVSYPAERVDLNAKEFHRMLERHLNKIKSIIERLELFDEDSSTSVTVLPEEAEAAIDKKVVFVVHGRDENLRKAMFEFLRAIDLRPLEWTQVMKKTSQGAPYVGDVLDVAFGQAQAVVVLLNGDDEVRLQKKLWKENESENETKLMPQARPNVLFEAGMAIGRSAKRTILVQIGELRPWSDIGGRHITHLNNTPEKRHELVQKLKSAGCEVDDSGKDWLTTGDFTEGLNPEEAIKKAEPEVSRGVDLEAVRKNWKLILQSLKAEGSYGNLDAFMRSACEPIAFDNGILTLGFYYTFHLEKMKEKKYQEILEKNISKALKVPIRLEYILIDKRTMQNS